MEKHTENSSRCVSENYGTYKLVEKRRTGTIGSGCRDTANTCSGSCNCINMGLFKRMARRIVGTNYGKSRRHIIKKFIYDTSGDAVVEATVLFPIMIMIFAALVLLSVYLPARAVLQRATQFAATALANEASDTWLFFDENSLSYYRHSNINQLNNVYADFFTKNENTESRGELITTKLEAKSISAKSGQLSVESSVVNNIFYKEVVVTAKREFPMPVDLSFIGFPAVITVTASSTAAVNNAEEFVRSIDMASDFAGFIEDRYGLHDITNAISSFGSRITSLLGW